MIPQAQVKMTPVDAKLFESVGYLDTARELHIKFRGAATLCFADVPRFRYTGLMTAPRKDGYYNTFIKDRFLTRPAASAP